MGQYGLFSLDFTAFVCEFIGNIAFWCNCCHYWWVLCLWLKKHLEQNCVDFCCWSFRFHCITYFQEMHIELTWWSLSFSAVNKMIKEHSDLFSDSQCKVCSAVLISESQKLTHYQVSEFSRLFHCLGTIFVPAAILSDTEECCLINS